MNTNKNEKPTFIGFASQKGGVGKSSLAEVLASILYYEKGYSILVVDCDGTQESFYKLRERELIGNAKELSEQMTVYFQRFGKQAYPIIRKNTKDALEEVQKYIHSNGWKGDIVLFDFPGHADTVEMLELSLDMDYILSPIESDPQSLVSSLAYARTIQELGVDVSDSRIQNLFLFWNKINRSASTMVVDHYTQYANDEGLTLLDSRIYYSVRFSRELAQGGMKSVFRSSYLPPIKSFAFTHRC